MVGAKGEAINESELLKVFNRNSISATDIYKWNNHVVSSATVKDTMGLRRQIVSRYPTSKVNIYNDMVYVFNRERCNDKTIEREWDNILLTANLVSDAKLQKEYLNYHITQFKKWPEVAKGFCNAGFQQLLVYKKDRQLMLVISIPKGASLDEILKQQKIIHV